MHLQHESRLEARLCKSRCQTDHGDLDHIGRRSLNWVVDGGALPCRAQCGVPRSEFRDWPAASELRRDGTVCTCLLLDRVDVATNPRIALKVASDEGLRRISRDASAGGQAKVTHAIRNAEVHHLRHGALIGVHVGGWLAEHASGGRTVNILSGGEGGDQVLIAGDVRQDA